MQEEKTMQAVKSDVEESMKGDTDLGQIQPPTELTRGEKAVGITFNPGKNPDVESCKRQYADLLDNLYHAQDVAKAMKNVEQIRMFSIAITEAQNSQMWAVKAITWQYD
jgi:hypothetical protein